MASSNAIKILVINPNTTHSMTASLQPPIDALLSHHKNVSCDFFTAPPISTPSSNNAPDTLALASGAIPSINSPADANASATYCFPFLRSKIPEYDAFLVACYSEHPLVQMLVEEVQNQDRNAGIASSKKFVIGIFEASVITSLGMLAQFPSSPSSDEDPASQCVPSFGIVSTGKIWEEALSSAVHTFLGTRSSILSDSNPVELKRFAGVETTGLTATELHDLPADEIRSKMSDAAARLVLSDARKKVRVICLGCAGMTRLEGAVREGVVRALGDEEAREVMIVDGVLAGVNWLIGVCRMRI
ncbi:Protein dcg1 [Stygiomarasmius scandens]|uniref:Protein dcg1 n=1 Tax=Marasmiellus scandens TaxID=2682957 RepID=A0ABR1J726_9AGAR